MNVSRESFSQLYSSDLGRALQLRPTDRRSKAAAWVSIRGCEERNLGVFGASRAQNERRSPEHYRVFAARSGPRNPEGESARQVYERVAVCSPTSPASTRGSAVVVTHGGVLDALRLANGLPLRAAARLPNLQCQPERASPRGPLVDLRWGDISHLTRDAALDDF